MGRTARITRIVRSRPAKIVGGLLVVLLGVMVFRAETMPSRQEPATKLTDDAPVDADAVAKHLGAVIGMRTISEATRDAPPEELAKLHAWLRATYPRTHEKLAREPIGDGGSALYTWAGPPTVGGKTKPPMILCAHLDVVPVEGKESDWAHPPFEGVVADGFVWGRGALDDKLAVVGIMEAIESLLAEGFTPDRTVYIAFGHDEEIGGTHGAQKIVDVLAARGVHAGFALDEGGAITHGIFPGLRSDVATVAIAEKGFLTVDLKVDMPGGHSSTPRPDTAVTVLTRGLARLDDRKMPAHLSAETAPWIPFIAPEQSFGMKLALANLWITRPLVERALEKSPPSDAAMRTTIALTGLTAGLKDNVIPAQASAMVNFRILPGDTTEDAVRHVREVVADDRVRVEPREESRREPSPMSSIDDAAFHALARSIREVSDDTIVAPIVTLGATDGRYYHRVATNVYRFLPAHLEAQDLARVHGKDERARVSDVALAVRFYRRFLRLVASP
jgi:carboxypeptidase PM20D1